MAVEDRSASTPRKFSSKISEIEAQKCDEACSASNAALRLTARRLPLIPENTDERS
jgi:hypothetical protein